MRVTRLLTLIVSALLLGYGFIAPSTYAQQSESGRLDLTTSPLPIKLIVKPGEIITADLRIKNNSTQTELLKVGLMKFSAYGEEGKPQLLDRAPGDDYFDWVSFSEDVFNAETNVWKNIKMTISVPPSGAFGYYYAVTFSRANPVDPSQAGTGVEGATAVLVLLDVDAPGAKRSLGLAEFKTTKGIYEFLPVTFRVRLTNDGNVHATPAGTIFISKGGKEVEQIALNSGSGSILPNSTRQFTTEWKSGFPKYVEKTDETGNSIKNDQGQLVYSLDWSLSELEQLRFGKYTATLVAVYDDGQRDIPIEASITFWVIPWRILGAGLLIVLLVGAGLFSLVRKLVRGAKKVTNRKHDQAS